MDPTTARWRQATKWLVIFVPVLLCLYDFVAYRLGGNDATFSKFALDNVALALPVVYGWGILTGHLWVPRHVAVAAPDPAAVALQAPRPYTRYEVPVHGGTIFVEIDWRRVLLPPLVLAAAVLGVLRLEGSHGAAFQAGAHMMVGGLFAAGLVNGWRAGRPYWLMGAALTAVEVYAFLRGM